MHSRKPERFDPNVDEQDLVTRMCGQRFSEIRYLHASGYWVDGKLGSLAVGSISKITAVRDDGQRCSIAVSTGQARRQAPDGVFKSAWAWSVCSPNDLWRHTKSLGFKVPERVTLTFD
jgi:hypothetical protein